MNDWNIPDKVAREAAYERADEFAEVQRRAFLAGFEAGINEAETMAQLREWLETQRDDAREQYERDDNDRMFARRLAFVEVLTKLSEMGCRPEDDG